MHESHPTRKAADAFAPIDIAEPAAPGAGEALVRIHRVGICGTDFGGYLGQDAVLSYPRIPGHELGVEVLAVGAGVTNVKPGDRCAVEPYINCQHCYSCRRGHTNCCEKHQTLGVHVRRRHARADAPARAQAARLDETRTWSNSRWWRRSPSAATPWIAATCSRASTCWSSAPGPIGLSAIEFVKLAGAKCIVMDLNEDRLAFCRERMGVDHTIVAADDGSELAELQAHHERPAGGRRDRRDGQPHP